MKKKELPIQFNQVEDIEFPLQEREEPNIIECNKNSIIQFTEFLLQGVEDGNINPLDAFISFKAILEIIDKAKKIIDDKALKEAEKHNNLSSYKGFKISIINGRKSYIFKNIPEIQNKENELKSIQEKYKNAFDGIDKGTTILENGGWVSQDGEILPLPEISFGKSYIKLEKLNIF